MPNDVRLLASPTDRHLQYPELLSITSEWFGDPIDPNVLLFKDDETGFLKAVDVEVMTRQDSPASVGQQLDFYGGRQLICPDDCRIKVVEQCVEPGSWYGPWRIIDRTAIGRDPVIGQSKGEAFASVGESVRALIGKPLPAPVPRPAAPDEPAVLPLPHAHTGLVYPFRKTMNGILGETYDILVYDFDAEAVRRLHVGDDQGALIRLRDEPEYFARLMGDSLSIPPEGSQRHQFEVLPKLIPHDKFGADCPF